ncbi:MAG TPA: twin-arginine translocase TatA/TatE family subunit [Thermomicrobiales bacterium]|jgi:TatA/E family protein of Tat protein translocase
MEFFGIGAPELMVILVIAIVMFGPDKIPTMAAQVGKTIRDFRRYTSELTKEFDAATGDLRQEFQNIAGDLRGELEATQADLRSQLDLTDAFKMDTPKAAVAAGVTAASEPGLAALESATATEAATAVMEPAPPETITVTTPYADALAAQETAGAATATPTVATKADPFADLVTLVVAAPAAEPETVIAAAPEPNSIAAVSSTTATNGHRKVVGGSVTGSKYSRRKSA